MLCYIHSFSLCMDDQNIMTDVWFLKRLNYKINAILNNKLNVLTISCASE